ncbi:MAG TPA: AAA family ATPase [Anaerolineaceae bacterium]|nr:AAA family ATPase [Anaerolineaceae bacterium]HPN52147.1 AAA family ATPase [Anaerolineaceae bacterium]
MDYTPESIPDPKRLFALRSLGFAEEPFSPSADPRFFYLSSQHRDTLTRCRSVIEFRQGLAVVEGDYGIGKSTIARRLDSLYRYNPDQYYVVYIDNASLYDSEMDILSDIAAACKITKSGGKLALIRALQSFVVEQMGTYNRNIVLILDDAQKISSSALSVIHTIYNFDQAKKLVQIILFAQPEIKTVFEERPEVRSRVHSWLKLTELPPDEAYLLINYRCKIAGRDSNLLDRSQFLRIWAMTGGLPRYLITMSSLIVEQVGEQNKQAVDDDVIEAAIAEFKVGAPRRASR